MHIPLHMQSFKECPISTHPRSCTTRKKGGRPLSPPPHLAHLRMRGGRQAPRHNFLADCDKPQMTITREEDDDRQRDINSISEIVIQR